MATAFAFTLTNFGQIEMPFGLGRESKLLHDIATRVSVGFSPDITHQHPIVHSSQILTSRAAFQTTVARVLELLEADDDDTARPDEYTVYIAARWLYLTYFQMDKTFPKGAAAIDEEGGIRIYWQSPTRNVQLAIPNEPSAKPWIYHQEGQEYSLDREVSPEKLAYWLNWLAQG